MLCGINYVVWDKLTVWDKLGCVGQSMLCGINYVVWDKPLHEFEMHSCGHNLLPLRFVRLFRT